MSQILRKLKKLQEDVKNNPRTPLKLVPQWERIQSVPKKELKKWAVFVLVGLVGISAISLGGYKLYQNHLQRLAEQNKVVLTPQQLFEQNNANAMKAYEGKNFIAARKLWLSMLKQQPKRSEVMVNLAMTERALAQFDQAQSYLEESLKAQPHAVAHNNLGLVFIDTQQFVKAEKQFLKAISLDANHADAIFNLATVYESTEDWVKANMYYNKYSNLTNAKEHLVQSIKARFRRVQSWATLQYNQESGNE